MQVPVELATGLLLTFRSSFFFANIIETLPQHCAIDLCSRPNL